MKEWDLNGHKLCEAQGRLFEESYDCFQGSSAVFIRLFMTSAAARSFDDGSVLDLSQGLNYSDLGFPESNGKSRANGHLRYSKNELYWMGYLYRYWAYTRQQSSRQVYHDCPGARLVSYYPAQHTQDLEAALGAIQESLSLPRDYDINLQLLEAYRKSWQSKKTKKESSE